jgi:hypothetical protein
LRKPRGRFEIQKTDDRFSEGQRVLILLPLKFVKNSFYYMDFGFMVPISPTNRV